MNEAFRRTDPTLFAADYSSRSWRKGQRKLAEAKVFIMGAGGLGSPAALYLAAAGVGTIGWPTRTASNLIICNVKSFTGRVMLVY